MSYGKSFYEKIFKDLLKTEGIIPFGNFIDVYIFAEMDRLHAQNEKLKALILLTDPAVKNIEMGSLSVTQWGEFCRAFPEEGRRK